MADDSRVLLLTYDEIALKGRKRHQFTRMLLDNIAAITDLHRHAVKDVSGRVQAEIPAGVDVATLYRQLRRVFGVRWFAEASVCPKEYDAIREAALHHVGEQHDEGARTFKVEASRRDKSFAIDSYQMACRLGDAAREAYAALSVNLDSPDAIVYVEIHRERALVYGRHRPGHGGLPVGSTGKALALVSGGIDSPVAVWQLMKRGVETECLYFGSPPYSGVRARQKVEDLVATLSQWAPQPIRLHVCHFTEIQEQIGETIPQAYWTICHRRFMHRIAHRIAARRGCQALCAGDSLGQVASQTLRNLQAIDSATDDVVLRPLLGRDKQEIIEIAREIGTYDISIRPYEDCCVLFAPKRPSTAAREERVARHESRLDIEGLVERAVERTESLLVDPSDSGSTVSLSPVSF